MTQKEIKDKIADWENRLKNPSVAGVPSAVTKINSEIAQLEAMLEKEEKPKAEKKEKVAKEPKFKVGDIVGTDKDDNLLKEIKSVKENKKGEIIYSGNYISKPTEKFSYEESEIVLLEKPKHEKHEAKETKAEHKKDSYNCDDLVKEAKERHAKAKAAAEARANAPKKSEATKDKEKIEKVHETVEKQLEKGKLNKSQLEKLIAETKDLLKLLEKALKNL